MSSDLDRAAPIPWRVTPRVHRIDPSLSRALDVPELAHRLRGRRGLAILDSAAGWPCHWSLCSFDPLPHAPLPGARAPETIADARAFVKRIELVGGDEIPGPFRAGFVGAFAYDLGVEGEARPVLPDDPWRTPRVVGGTYVDFVVRDERSGDVWLVLGEGDLPDRAPLDARSAELRSLLEGPSPPRTPANLATRGPLVRHTSAAEHRARIERVRADIAAGDYYQANVAHRFTREVEGDPLDWYLRLRRCNPAPYMGWFAWDEHTAPSPSTRAEALRSTSATSPSSRARQPRGALLSASPELLFEFDGREARTRPIKGTAPRDADPERDRAHAERLAASEKDRAELAMIVDLERNDLGRRARPGSVRVERFAHLESYARVHHLTADVVAEPAAGVDAFDLLSALFPGGSITGAPKLASMAAIAREEGAGRGFFTGSMGFVDTRGHAAWNILIRTLVWRPTAEGGEMSFHVGGGITWLSDAADEERETMTKAAALIETLTVPLTVPPREGRA